MFELSRYLFSQISEIGRVKSSVNNILFLTMIFIKSRVELLIGYIAVLMRRCEIDLSKGRLSLVPLLSVGHSLHFITNVINMDNKLIHI